MKPRDSHRLFVLVCLLVSFSASLPDPQVLCPTFVDEGERLMCECSSPNDVHNPTITWPGHSDTYILDKANISRHDNGTIFTCRMESNGQISTAIYTLQVAYGPSDNTVEILGPDVFVTDGSVTLTLTCNASDVNPPDVDYAWYGLGLYCDGGNQGSTCSFRPQPRQHDGKIVTCRASNGAGQTIVTAKTDYVLNMTYPPTSSPVITGFTEGQVLKAGDNLTCTVADGKPLVSDVFFHCTNPTLDDQSYVADQSSVSSTVTIDSVNATGGETYCTCTADWEPGKYNITYELNNSAIVYIEYAATILNFTINNSTDVVEMIQTDHTTATLECTALGQPTPELRMTRHGEEIQGNVIKSSGYVENVLVISDVTCEDMGTYMCLADNGHQDTRSVRLIVNCAPTLTDHDGDSNLPEMAVNGLFLSMVAHPVPYSFSWEQTRQSDNNGTRNIATLFLVTCVNSGHLEYLVTCEIHAVNLSETEAGLYSVSLSNGYGEYTYNFKISGDQGLTQEDESSPEGGTDDIIISLSVVGGLAFFVLLFIGIKTALSCFSKGPDRGRREVSQAVLQNVASSSDDLSPPQPSTSETKGSPHSYENRGQLRHSDPGYASAEDVHLHAPPSSPAGLHRQSAVEHATRDSGGYASLSDNSRPSNNYCAYSTPVENSLPSLENGTEGRITDADKSDPSGTSKGQPDNTNNNARPKAGGSQQSSNKYTHVVKPKRAGKGVGSTTKPVIAPIADENSTNTNDEKGNGSGSVDGKCVKTPNTEPLSQDPSQSVVTEDSYNILQFHRQPTVADIKTDYSHLMNG